VAIIALLVSILLPSLGRAKAAAKLVVCATNMNGIGKAVHLYAGVNNGCVPRDGAWSDPTGPGDDGTYNCFSRISPYVGGPKIPLENDVYDFYLYPIYKSIGLYLCPSAPARYPDHVLTYISNGYNFEEPTNWGSPARSIDNIPFAPADIGFIAEADLGTLDSAKDRLESELTGGKFGAYDFPCEYTLDGSRIADHAATYNLDGTPNGVNRMIADGDDRHYGKTVVVFFDGHAEIRWLNPDDMAFNLFHPKIPGYFD
jgi:prepilin-type processing-associated H-X9-DG protein